MDDILEGFLWIFFYFFLFLLGVYGAYLKLYDKNSWLYKESQQEKGLIISIAKVQGE